MRSSDFTRPANQPPRRIVHEQDRIRAPNHNHRSAIVALLVVVAGASHVQKAAPDQFASTEPALPDVMNADAHMAGFGGDVLMGGARDSGA